MKKYEFIMPTGNLTIRALIREIKISEGVLRAVKVGEAVGSRADGSIIYEKRPPREFIAVGGYTLQEYIPPEIEEKLIQKQVMSSIPQI